VISEPVDSEILIYDAARHTAHCLTAEVARVWECCDGTRSATEIAQTTELERDVVDATVAALADRGLLVGYSRREALRLAAAAAPLIYSLAVPTPAAAQSMGLRAGCPVVSCDAPPRERRPVADSAEQPVRFRPLLHLGHRPALRLLAGVSR
jgi:hypothetical protein